jgi:hypothetical protein
MSALQKVNNDFFLIKKKISLHKTVLFIQNIFVFKIQNLTFTDF